MNQPMPYLVLARKYRPQTFEEVVGQHHVTRTLSNAIAMNRVPHAVLFSGPRGTGKTTVARILAKAVNCENGPAKMPCNTCRSCVEITRGNAVDVFEIDGASNNSVDQVRELRENIKYMPSHSRYKIYIIDEVHMLSTAAFNALLKTLEEPPSHVIFLFATTEPQKIPLTILSRCQRHDFRRIDIDSIIGHLEELCRKEAIHIDRESLVAVAREAGGSLRDALSLLDQVISCFEGNISYSQLVDALGIVDRHRLIDISDAVLKGKIPAILEILDRLYDRGHDVKKLFSDILAHFRNMAVIKMATQAEKIVDLPAYEINRIREQIKTVPLTHLNQVLDFLLNAEPSIRYSDHPKIALELAFIKLMQVKPALPIDALIQKIDELAGQFDNTGNRQPPKPSSTGRTAHLKTAAEPSNPPPGTVEHALPATAGPSSNDEITPDDEIVREPAKAWERVVRGITENSPALAANLAEAGVRRMSEDTIEIDVNGSAFNLNMVKREKSLALLQEICDAVLKKKMKLIIHRGKKPGSFKEKNAAENHLKQEALNHPLTSDALAIFNGRILDIELIQDT
ncbi:MAG: DNA polymerase III subunit gamma/tau [Desulfobacterales bacterium]